MTNRIRVATIITEGDTILLIKHVHPETGYEWWVPPGGGLEEQDKSLFDCAKREVYEEANLRVDVSRILYLREFVDRDNNILNLECFLLADKYEGEAGVGNTEGTGLDARFIKGLAWFKKEELQNLNVFPEILKDDFWEDRKINFPMAKYLGRQG